MRGKRAFCFARLPFESVEDAISILQEGYPLVISTGDSRFTLVTSSGGRLEVTEFGDTVAERSISQARLAKLINPSSENSVWICTRQFDCDSVSSSPFHANHQRGKHMTPLSRFIGLLRLELIDIWSVILFAFVSGLLTLATPLAIESLVNVVSWGTYLQPLVVLGVILLVCLGIAGVLKVLQKLVVELIQRRQFVRIVSDLAHRFPRANQESLTGKYPREYANRVFDIMTIQKATAVLLLDGVSIVLTAVLGMLLLAFYHPFLLGFDIVLLISMISITWVLGRGGVSTAIEESATKYRVAHWLQDVLASPAIFKTGGGEGLAIQRANQLTAEYIRARKRQFGVVIRQSAFAISLQVIASTAVLALGGWLVIEDQLTLGQLVASELVVTIVVGAFAKAGKSLEKFYDLMAGIDKVGHLIDIPADEKQELGPLPEGPAPVRWGDLVFSRASSRSYLRAAEIEAGARVAIVGDDIDGRSSLARTLAGLQTPSSGTAQVGPIDSSQAAAGQLVGYAGALDVFAGTLRENVDLGRPRIGPHRVRQVLDQAGLSNTVLQLTKGLQTQLQTGGHPLSESEVIQMVVARTIASQPKLLIIDRLLDELPADTREHVWQTLAAEDAPWTLMIVTNRDDLASSCDTQISVRKL